jgi:carboxyl-terminal processing protease
LGILILTVVFCHQEAVILGQTPVYPRENLDFTLFWQVWDRLERNYLDPEKVDPEKMVYGAIEGMTAALGDPYTVFLPPTDNKAAKEDLNGEFDGVGIQLGYKQGTLAVMTPLEGHPAIKQGVKAGDLILRIQDKEKILTRKLLVWP